MFEAWVRSLANTDRETLGCRKVEDDTHGTARAEDQLPICCRLLNNRRHVFLLMLQDVPDTVEQLPCDSDNGLGFRHVLA